MSKRVRGFHQASRAWYWIGSRLPDELESFIVGAYYVEPDDGCEYEFTINLAKLIGSEFAWSVKIYDESWPAFAEFVDVFTKLALLDHEDVTAEKVRAALTECGVVDLTEEKRT